MGLEEYTSDELEKLADLADEMSRQEHLLRIEHARKKGLFRDQLAHWEVAELFRCLMPLALHDVMRVNSFEEFRELWSPIMGEKGLRWLPSLYLAVAASPSVHNDLRRIMVLSALPFLQDDKWI